MWFPRDLRLSDNPALVAAARHASPDGEVVALFCRDPYFGRSSGVPRRAFLADCRVALDRDLGGRLVVRMGRPETSCRRSRRRDRRVARKP
jgi:deoxyribodipyrimidine photo-lyase